MPPQRVEVVRRMWHKAYYSHLVFHNVFLFHSYRLRKPNKPNKGNKNQNEDLYNTEGSGKFQDIAEEKPIAVPYIPSRGNSQNNYKDPYIREGSGLIPFDPDDEDSEGGQPNILVLGAGQPSGNRKTSTTTTLSRATSNISRANIGLIIISYILICYVSLGCVT